MNEPRSIELTIRGQPPRKGNQRRIVIDRKTGKRALIKSKAALAYVESVYLQTARFRLELGSKTRPLCIQGRVYYPWRWRGDLSAELILDALQAAHVISDDRYVVVSEWMKCYDATDPRVELTIAELEEWDWNGRTNEPAT